ncbi:hypothetical protein EYZ11_005907 [Aspergillus tanneri]|uniref:Uncharacterized protein n=1 Tax=Aspergillus tanneri TaxID=1220188 RepID=A0A4S3JGU2_9EURO|nr:hypothetical protein EYZ11_005907 [Aspergillus tanneri]
MVDKLLKATLVICRLVKSFFLLAFSRLSTNQPFAAKVLVP